MRNNPWGLDARKQVAPHGKQEKKRSADGRKTARTILLDDHTIFLLGLRYHLSSAMPEIELVGEADSPADGLALAARARPDLVLVASPWGDRPTGEVLTALTEMLPEGRLVVLADVASANDLTLAISAGADGYLLKTIAPDQMVIALREVLDGEAWIQPELSRQLYSEFTQAIRRSRPSAKAGADLTRRQLDVLRLIVQGLRNAEIAEQLSISEQTVKTHIANLLRKLGVRSRLQAAQYAVRHRLVEI
jgi:two-component system nitrate/nitrite response regulator NarL